MEALLGREQPHNETEHIDEHTSSTEYEDSTVSETEDLKNLLEAHARELTEQLKREITLHAESITTMAEVNAAPKKNRPKVHATPLTNMSVIQDETTGLIF